MVNNNSYKEQIKNEIEKSLGRVLHTPSDFRFASKQIFEQIHENLSPTTMMRLWGYVNDSCKTRMTTFNILSRFLNYPDFQSFCNNIDNVSEVESNAFKTQIINSSSLKVGDCIEFSWNPGRLCRAEYLGEKKFKILHVEKSKLQVGDTFTCHSFILNHPLYLLDICNVEDATQAYVAGSNNGITSLQIIPK